MLTDSQKQVLKQIALRRIKEGPSCYFDTNAHFQRLMEGALFANPNLTREEFLRLAREELTKCLQK